MSNLHTILTKIAKNHTDWKTYPILLKWYESGRMSNPINILEKKVDKLLREGATAKVKEWVSTDVALTQITAERYLLDYLGTRNSNFRDSFTGGGVDGYLQIKSDSIGLEVTTVNQSIPEWILHERLLAYLSTNRYARNDGIEITYDLSKLEPIKFDNLNIIQKIGDAILRENYHSVNGVAIKKISKRGAYISWNNTESNNNFFVTIENSLTQILSQKSKQLSKNQQNILFVGVNQLPNSIFNPGIFKELVGHIYHQDWIDELNIVTRNSLPVYVIGVCFFVYTLPSEEMMYPLKVIWRDPSVTVPINL